jgi:hypothetical protein
MRNNPKATNHDEYLADAGKPLPARLVRKIVRYRIAENAAP